MVLTDTHTHLNSTELEYSPQDLIRRAGDKNVTRLFIPNIDAFTIDDVLNLGIKFPNTCFPMLGLHPVHVAGDFEEQLDRIASHARLASKDHRLVAIGEAGMDLFHDTSFKEQQIAAFTFQARLALELDLPLVIHCRNAFLELTALMRELMITLHLRGIFHCFTGSLEEAQTAINMGFYLGIGGVLTYKNSQLPEVVKEIPLSSIVLETDAPYLSPVPRRGKPNEPANIIYIATKLAEIKGIPLDEVARITTENSVAIFGR